MWGGIYLTVVLIDVEPLFMRLLAICTSSLEKFMSTAHSLIELFVGVFFFCRVVEILYIFILNINPLSDTICKYFLPCYGLSFHFLDDILWKKFLISIKSNLSIFLSLLMLLVSYLRRLWLSQSHKHLLLYLLIVW